MRSQNEDKLRQKKCQTCGERFAPFQPMQKACSPGCAIGLVRKEKRKAVKQDTRRRRQALKPISKLMSETQAVINRYVRLRDRAKGCVSCDRPATWDGQWHASHFHPRGRSSRLRFNLNNIHKSCSVCNAHLSGNLLHYKPELIRRIGREEFDWMESVANEPTKYDPDYLRRMKRIFLKRCRLIESR